MQTFVLATNSERVSETLCSYLETVLDPDDSVYAVNSQRGGDSTSSETVADGKAALEVVSERLGDQVSVETYQIIRGNSPATDIFDIAAEVDADELVIGVRKRSQTDRLIFGSVAQDIMRQSDYPMRVVPRE
ncbi:universal stress protein [Haloarcula japonica]|uniref:Universal stress protein UspA-like protein n=1 Tax=Haloarcula japonica (strain ATCC 49778 / DSM 6131 / JCM 7785 / NBRC 101032 / NCIMB 13157 / TR-1) TaxID=1227453 RepID=M0LHZ7_HALJT|nr:universal stress protein [Haloarcula japonica]EMA33151.1 universal stress protein UspA-like protein [Haloarcula japonica DSM 6131]